MGANNMTEAKRAVLMTHGVTCFEDVFDFDEAKSLITFSDGSQRQLCEIFTRVMGYHRPTMAFNNGKKQEHKDRKYFREASASL